MFLHSFNVLENVDLASLAILVPVVVLLTHLVPWFLDPHGIRSIPGPFLAKFSDVWLGWVSAQGHRSEVVHEMHKKYGPLVRLAPNHVSIAHPSALQIIYAHGNGALKSNFYDAFVSIQRGLFNTRDRAAHARKRKIVSHVFSPKSVLEFEPSVREYVGLLIKQWDQFCESAKEGKAGKEGGGWEGRDGRVWLDCLPFWNFLAFDIIGDLAFGAPFGMLEACKDSAQVPTDQKATMDSYALHSSTTSSSTPLPTYETMSLPAVQIINDRGDFSASLGVLPPWWRPLVKKYIPWYRKGAGAVKNLAGIAVLAIAKRLSMDKEMGLSGESGRVDLLSKLREGKDEEGKPMGREELTAEALTQLIAGSDTTSNSSCAITYHLAHNPQVQRKLQAELDANLATEDLLVSTNDQVKHLPYLEAVINEGLRIHSTSAMGLARLVPANGMTIEGREYKEGTVLSVPSFTIHRDKEVWGDNAETFRPERWFERDKDAIAKTFNPYSYGPRACVGRNLASMQLLIIISSILRRYDFVLEEPNKPFETREGFLRKPLECRVGIKRRDA